MQARTRRAVAVSALAALFGAGLWVPAAETAREAPEATASSIKPRAGAYRGKTAQGKPVRFRVENRRVKNPTFTVRRGGCSAEVTFPVSTRIGKSGRFSFGSTSSHYFKGRFVTRRKVRGRLGIDFSLTSCPANEVKSTRYRAHHD